MCVSADPLGGVLRGASVCSQADGRYAVDLCLVAGFVPLLELAEEVRGRVRGRARREGLIAQLGEVNVEFVRVLSAAEISEEEAPEREEKHAPPPSPTKPSAPPVPSRAEQMPAAEPVTPDMESPATEVKTERHEVSQEQALLAHERTVLAQERTLLAQEWTLLAQERTLLAQEREEGLTAETPPTSVSPSESSSDPTPPAPTFVDGEQLP
jgi:cell division protein FtsN